jgi:hypothetical protein
VEGHSVASEENSAIGNFLRGLVLIIILPYGVLYFGFTDPAVIREGWGDSVMTDGQFYMVLGIAGAFAALFTWLLRKLILLVAVLSGIAYGLYAAFMSLG